MKKKFKTSSTISSNQFPSQLLSWGEFPTVFRKVNFQSFAAFVLDQNCTTNLSYQPPDYWWASGKAIYWVKTIKKNNIMKLTAYFDFSPLSSPSVAMQHHSSHRRNYPTYWHHLQPPEYMTTTSTSANRQNHCAQHYTAAVETQNFKRMLTSRVSADVWNTKRPCRFDKVSLLKHILLWGKKQTNRFLYIWDTYCDNIYILSTAKQQFAMWNINHVSKPSYLGNFIWIHLFKN